MSKISIINLSHNRPAMLKRAIESIFKQTEQDWELITIDDCSTESGMNNVLDWASKDKRVKVYTCEENVNNLAVLWNKGIDFSSGKYICLLDDDNRREPEYLAILSGWLDNNDDYDAVACFAKIFQGNKQTAIFDHPIRMTKKNIKENNYIDSGCMMFRRSLIDKIGWFDERLKSCDDWDFVKRIMLQTDKGFGIIEEPLAVYYWHKTNRSYVKSSLGDVENQNFIVHKKNYDRTLDLLLFHQDKDKISLSQNNVLEGIMSALEKIDFLRVKTLAIGKLGSQEPNRLYDIVFNFAPFSIDAGAVQKVSTFGKEVVSFHIEDPQALGPNLERARFATYIFTNDISVIENYEKIIGRGRVGYCPSISLDDINLDIDPGRIHKKKEYGVVFYGYSYESRKKFVKELEPKLKKARYPLTVIGGGWNKRGKNYIGELSQAESLDILRKSKIIILKNRENTDLGGDKKSIIPQSVVRGYFEAGSGTMMMIDNSRKHHSFGKDEIIFYKSTDDLVEKVRYYMKHNRERDDIGLRAQKKALEEFTYQKRIRKLINAVRSMRFYFEMD